MKKRLIALCIFTLYLMAFFFAARLFFILFQFKEASQFSLGTLAATFWYGLKLDISVTSYFLVFPVMLAIPGIYFNGNWYKSFMKYYTWLIIIFSSAIIVSDANLYTYWGFRMDITPVLYLKTPKEAMASVSTFKIIFVFATIALISFLAIWVYNKLINRFFYGFERVRYWLPAMVFFLVLWGALIIPIRGGIGIAPINAGTVYFSQDLFPNHTAINVVWNVGSSAFVKKPTHNPYVYGDLQKASEVVDTLTVKRGSPEKLLNTPRPNIMIIILESFGSTMVGPLGGDPATTPAFNKNINEGILFTNFYASGNRTDKALPAILDGFPAQPTTSIIKDPKKTQSLPSIVKVMNGLGYNSSFWYGGEINFANFNSFIISSGFKQIITKNNFNPKDFNSKWGVHDHIMFEALKDSLKNVHEPFINVTLTLSSHEPFEVPMIPVFKGTDNLTRFRNSIFYTDKSLGDFLDWAKTTGWWKNTLIILVADHCCRITIDIPVYSEKIFRIPMLWLGGALSEKGIRVEKFGSQVDIPVTVLNQLDLSENFPFSKDLLSTRSESFAFYVYNEGFAFMTDSSKVIFDQKLKEPVLKEGVDPESAENKGKAYLQVLFDNYLKR